MRSRRTTSPLIVALVISVWLVFTVLALTWGITVTWPDFVHVNYGFPLVWATHTVSTIAGVADTWTVSISTLWMDLLLWLAPMTAAVAVILHFLNRRS